MNKEMREFFENFGACDEGLGWVSQKESFKDAWETCDRVDWMLWALEKIGFQNYQQLRLFACACVRKTPLADGRTVWDLLTDERSRNAVVVAELFAEGMATEEERIAASAAARDAAWDAASAAAWDAARDAARDAQAQLLRKWIPWDEVEAVLKRYQEAV